MGGGGGGHFHHYFLHLGTILDMAVVSMHRNPMREEKRDIY